MARPNLDKLAQDVVRAMRIAQKPNPRIERAKRRYGPFIDELIRKKELKLTDFSQGEQKIIEKLQAFKYGPLVYQSGDVFKVKTTVGETVQIVYTRADKNAVRLARAIRESCWELGCHVLLIPHADDDSRACFKLSPASSLVELPPLSKAIAEHIDVGIFVGYEENLNWRRGIEQKVKLAAPATMTLQQIKDRRRVRWVIVGLPVKMRRGDYIVDPKKYETVFFDSLGATYTPIVKQLCAYYRKKLSGVGRIRITANDGTDLSFSIRGRPILVDDGVLDEEDLARGDVGLNIPDGEVFVAPLEHSANGRIRFDFVFPSGFGLIKNLWITFEGGKVTSFSADGDGAKRFQKFLDSNTGEKDRIAELGIGTNPAAQFIGAILIDEKIYGSIHIAIGSNTGAYHGKNKASSHLDMIKIMRGQGGRVYADERLVMDNGLPVGLK